MKQYIPRWTSFGKCFAYTRLLFSLDYTSTDVLLILGGILFSIAAGLPFPLLGIVFGDLINDLNTVTCSSSPSIGSEVSDALPQRVLYVIYITIANFFFLYIHCSCWSYTSERIARRYRRRYFESIIRQEMGYHDGLPAGEVVSRLVSDIEIVQSGTSEKVGLVVSTVSYVVASYIVAFIKVPAIAGMLVSVVPCYFFMTFVGGFFIQRYGDRIAEHVNAAISIASSSLSHLTLVHAFNSHERLEKLFADHLSKSRMDALKKAGTHAGQLGLQYFIAYASNSLAFWEGSHLIADSVEAGGTGTSVGAVYTVVFVLIDASFILSQVAPFVHVFASATAASQRLLTVINRESKIDGTSESGDKSAPLNSVEISFRNVHFTYPSRPDVPVLKGVNFVIPARKHTAIVGPSGGGKSTIVALLERFYDPLSGEIYIGNQDFRDLNVRHLRGHIGLVQQEPSLLDRSILENIAYGLVSSAVERHQTLAPFILDSTLPDLVESMRAGVTQREALEEFVPEVSEIVKLVRQAAESSNALTFIDALPHGFATCVGSFGSHLSGGQKQRIALARALIREPSILILDEATAALDSGSERLIQEALAKATGRITIISITHRLSAAKSAHKIVLIQNGRVFEEGAHTELVANGRSYAEMVRLQNLGTVLTPDMDAIREIQEDFLTVTSRPAEKQAFMEVGGKDITAKAPCFSVINQLSERERTRTLRMQKKKQKSQRSARECSLRFATRFIFSLFRPHIGFILLGLAMSGIIGGSYTAEAVIFGHTIGSLNPCIGADAIRHGGHVYGLLFFIMALVEISANVVGGCAFGWAADKILYRLRVLSLRSLLGQTIQWHDEEGRTPSELITHITGDASALSSITGTTIGLLLATAVNLVAGLVVSFAIAWKIAIVLLPTIPIMLVAGVMKLRTQVNFAKRHQKAFAQATAITLEGVDNIRTLSAFSLERQSFAVYERALQAPYAETLRSIAIGNVFLATAFSISNLVYALAYWWGSRQIVAGLYSQTQFFIVLPALLFSTQSCGQMFALAPDISKAGVAASNIAELLTTRSAEEEMDSETSSNLRAPDIDLPNEKVHDPEMIYPALTEAPPIMSGVGVELRNVHFEYPSRPHQPVLRGLNLTFRPGHFCALVGPSGSGKSTILAMLERFYRPQSGAVIIDGVDITRQLDTKFRDDIALVPQENVLFEGTVAFNISLGARPRYQPTQNEIEDACRMANVHDVIMSLPMGYETQCSHDGKQFSGGQRQRLSIARALVRRPRMLLLDESTSALDVESETRIQEALATLSDRTTIIAIAHRLNTIHRADCIYLIADGRCVKQGTHEELIERSQSYRTNVIHQSLEV